MKTERHLLLLLIAAAIVTLAGAGAEWIHFPISTPVKGLDWTGADTNWWRRFPAAPFIGAQIGALALLVRGNERAGGWLQALAMGALLAVPAYALFLDSTWLQTYAEDAVQHFGIKRFLSNFADVPNTGIEFYLADAAVFEYLPDRLRIVVGMLGWGWSLALAGSVALTLVLRRIGRLSSWRVVARPLALLCLLLAASGVSTIAGDFRYRQADQRLALGDYAGAIDSYNAALQHDRALEFSDVFLLKTSKAFYQSTGPAHPAAALYLASVMASTNPEGAKARLLAAAPDDSPIGIAFARMAQRKVAEVWIRQGLLNYARGNVTYAAHGFRQVLASGYDARHVRFYLAQALARLHEFDESVRLFESLAATMHNPSSRADVYNALGDTYAAAGDQFKARAAYANAYSLDSKGNLWAVKGLSGT